MKMKALTFLKSRVFWFYVVISILLIFHAGRITAMVAPPLIVASIADLDNKLDFKDYKLGFQAYVEKGAEELHLDKDDIYFNFSCSFAFSFIFVILVIIGFFIKKAIINLLLALMTIEIAFGVIVGLIKHYSFENYPFDVLVMYLVFSLFLTRPSTKHALIKTN